MKTFNTILFLFIVQFTFSQTFLNGDFENNGAAFDQLGLSNAAFNASMENCNAYGTNGNMDILTTTTWLTPGPQNGDWYTGVTGGGTDKLNIELDEPFLVGVSYTVTFFDCRFATIPANMLSIGVSNVNNNLGTEVYQTTTMPISTDWTERTFTFISPISANYMTVSHVGGGGGDWVAIDNFQVICDTSIDLGDNVVTCAGEEVILNAGTEGGVYEWQDGSTDSTLVVTETGLFSVNVDVDGCSVYDLVAVTFVDYPVISMEDEIEACEGEVVTVSASNNILIPTYEWEDGSTGSSIEVSTSGYYAVEVSNANLCSSSDSTLVTFNAYPQVDLGEDQTICNSEELELNAGSGAFTFQWQDGSDLSTFTVQEAGVYSVIVSNGDCSASDEVEIFEEFCDATLEMPNIFTPNGDLINFFFEPIERINVESWDCKIYNRWGNLMFETKDLNEYWDGTLDGNLVGSGTYYYLIKYIDKAAQEAELSGYLMVIGLD